MSEPFMSEIRIMSFEFAPRGWAKCNGQLLPINQNQGLFALLGTTYGGDGRVSFGLPDLRGRTPIHRGSGTDHPVGDRGGEQAHTLTLAELPTHTHAVRASPFPATGNTPGGNTVLAPSTASALYGPYDQNAVALAPGSLANAGGSQAHLNMQPFLALNFCIALVGLFPVQN